MWYHTAINLSLLAVPVAITLGVYVGVEFDKFKNYPVYPKAGSGGSGGSASGGGGYYNTPFDGPTIGIQQLQYCNKSIGLTPYPGRYVYNPNQWGDTDNSGTLCLNVTTDGSKSPKSKDAYAFLATWVYPQSKTSNPVHAYPNAKLALPSYLPIQVGNMSTLVLDVNWSYAIGNDNVTATDDAALDGISLNANVALDMFLSPDKNKSESTTDASFEIMVWLAQYGPSTKPIGWDTGSQLVQTINGTSFDLYYGTNTNTQQKVFTWVARGNTTSFTGDISPLVNGMSSITGPGASDNLGYIAFGSEALWAQKNVTFSVPHLKLDVTSKA